MKALNALTATTGNRTDCWNTPPDVVSDVLRFFNGRIGLDPCSNSKVNPNVPADIIYTEEDDGLSKEWDAPTVFMNHPYSESRLWIPYAVEQNRKHKNEMLLLIKLDISTKWYRSIAGFPWLAYNRRLKFGDGKGAAPFQSAMVYLGYKSIDRFKDVFIDDGTIYTQF